MWKCGGKYLFEAFYGLIIKYEIREQMPSEWQRSIVCTIYRKGDKLVCNNYRGISLLCVPCELFTSILRDRLEQLVERIIGEYQAGFRKGRSTTYQIFTVKQILEKCWERHIDLFQIFIDFQQAYDSVGRAMIGYIMREFGIPEKLVRPVELTLENTICCDKMQMEMEVSSK
jgi:sorting nexin-29